MKELVGFICLLMWIAGAVIAKGFWSAFFCIIPFWSCYLVIEFAFKHWGIFP